jgi:hypothetical protein
VIGRLTYKTYFEYKRSGSLFWHTVHTRSQFTRSISAYSRLFPFPAFQFGLFRIKPELLWISNWAYFDKYSWGASSPLCHVITISGYKYTYMLTVNC